LLLQDEFTAKDISRILGVREKEVFDHLLHVRRSAGPSATIVSKPARCMNCDFVFKKRDRVTTPGKCPVCKSERISEPLFKISTKKG